MYTIGQVSKMFNIPISTLRYYDKEGFFPNIKRISGIRKFDDTEIESIRVIECLKKSGMDIKGIKNFLDLCTKGSETYHERKDLLLKQKQKVESEIYNMKRTLDMINFKCWYYDKAIEYGNEETLNPIRMEDMPKDILRAYINTHDGSN